MAGVGLLALLDDVVSVLDDVAVMSKRAASSATGVLGDDLALTAGRLAGLKAAREIPVVIAVFKGSLVNKAILVPAAMALDRLAPWLVGPILLLGGAWLCLEGAEKILHALIHRGGAKRDHGGAKNEEGEKKPDEVGTRLDAGGKNLGEGGIKLDAGGARLGEGGAKLDTGGTKLDEGGKIIDEFGTKLDEGGTILDGGEKNLDEGGIKLDEGGTILDGGEKNLDEGGIKLDEGGIKLDAGGAKLDEGGKVLGDSSTKLDAGGKKSGDGEGGEAAEAQPDEAEVAELERRRIKGAVRTDLVLSAEIVVITLGSLSPEAAWTVRLGALAVVAILASVAVYGLVAAIVKLDDLGLRLLAGGRKALHRLGSFLVGAAPKLTRFLSVAGTAAMLLVGGGILVHGLSPLHHLADLIPLWGPIINGLIGLLAGLVLLAGAQGLGRIRALVRR